MSSWLPYVSFAVVAVGAVVAVLYSRKRRSDQLTAMMKKRQEAARLVTRGEFAEGLERMPVSLALTETTFHYENADFAASIDVADIDEVEYDDELATGRSMTHDCRVLRLRAHGNSFDFILQPGDCERWTAVLPPRRMGDQLAVAQ
jgi:hypothetical protein